MYCTILVLFGPIFLFDLFRSNLVCWLYFDPIRKYFLKHSFIFFYFLFLLSEVIFYLKLYNECMLYKIKFFKK